MVRTRNRATDKRELSEYDLHHRRLGKRFTSMLGLGIFMAILAGLLSLFLGKSPKVAENVTGAAGDVTAKVGELGSGAVEGGKGALGTVGNAAVNVTSKVGNLATGIGIGKSLDFFKSGDWGVNETISITSKEPIEFEYDSAVLTSNGQKVVANLAKEINGLDADKFAVKIVGHSSRVGEAEYNQNLSSKRANTVVQELTNLNVKQELSSEGKGFSSPLPGIAPDDERQQRTEVFVTRLK